MAEFPSQESALTEADVVRIAQHAMATIPTKADPAEYTQFFVDSAIVKYETEGLVATLAHYNRSESVDEQWYVFIFDDKGTLISHFNPNLLGENLNGRLGTDGLGTNSAPRCWPRTNWGGGSPMCTIILGAETRDQCSTEPSN